jgi:hypothetical protein
MKRKVEQEFAIGGERRNTAPKGGAPLPQWLVDKLLEWVFAKSTLVG